MSTWSEFGSLNSITDSPDEYECIELHISCISSFLWKTLVTVKALNLTIVLDGC